MVSTCCYSFSNYRRNERRENANAEKLVGSAFYSRTMDSADNLSMATQYLPLHYMFLPWHSAPFDVECRLDECRTKLSGQTN